MSRFDVVGLGAVAVDELIYVDVFPTPDVKTRVSRTERQCGGLTATALVAAARLGSRCAYAGCLGTDNLSAFCVEALKGERIDLAHLLTDSAVQPVHSFIVVGEQGHTRNVFAHSQHFNGPPENWPPEDVLRGAKVLLIDHFGISGMIRAARVAREHGVEVVADAERQTGPGFAEWLASADHLILSTRFAKTLTHSDSSAEAVLRLWDTRRKVAVVTDGSQGCWYTADGQTVNHQAAFPVRAIDTTGCGDVFHGAYASALARDLPLPERIRFASVAAALKATCRGGQAGIPGRDVVESALAQRVVNHG